MDKEEVVLIMSTDWHIKRDNKEEIIKLFEQKIHLADELQQTDIFVLGDIFDSRVSQRLDVLDTLEEILGMAEYDGITVHMIPGNHDKTDYYSERSFLRYFRHHPAMNLIEKYDVAKADGKHVIHMLPFFAKDSDLWKKNLGEAIAATKRFPKHNHILLSHCSVVGSVNNDGSKVTDGVKVSALKAFKYVFLGHYHNKQKPAKNVWHIPSLRQNNFGEDEKKGFTVLYADGELETVSPDFTRYKKVKIDLSSMSHEEVMEIADTYKGKTKDNKIRFEIAGNEAEVQSFDVGYLNELGIDVKKKRKDLVPQEEDLVITDELFIWKPKDIIKRFEGFCEDNNVDYKQGKELLNKILV